MIEPISLAATIASTIAIINKLFKIFRSITKWLKRRQNSLWKEDHRILKIVKDYFDRNTSNRNIEPYMRGLINRLIERNKTWAQIPGASVAEAEAQTISRYSEVGYTTDIDSQDESDNASSGNHDSDEDDDDSSNDPDSEGDDISSEEDGSGGHEEDDDDDDDDPSGEEASGGDEDSLWSGEEDEDD